jgi:hypothetical protein
MSLAVACLAASSLGIVIDLVAELAPEDKAVAPASDLTAASDVEPDSES